MTVIFDPPAAIAAGICLTARTIADGRTARHPRPCGWCDWALDALRSMVAGFEAWADRDPKTGIPRRFEAVVFQSLPPREQAALVTGAQSFPDNGEGAVESLSESVRLGPHGSHVRGETGSNTPAETPVEPVAAAPPMPAHDDDEGGPTWMA